MKFLYIIKKCKQVGLLFFIVSVANAAAIENNEGYLDNQLEAFALLIDEESIDVVEVPTISQRESKDHQKLASTQSDKPKTTLGDLNKEKVQPKDAQVFFSKKTKVVNSSHRATLNALKKDFLFKSITASPNLHNQSLSFHNSQDLKMLAHNMFGEQTLNDVLKVREEVKMLLDLTDTWIKEVLFDDRNWRLEDSIYGSVAIMFIRDSSLIRFLKKLEGNFASANRTGKYSEQQNNVHNNLVMEADADIQRSYGIMDFWNKYSGVFIYLVFPIIIVREVYKLISNTSKSKKKQHSRRGSKRNSRQAEKKEKVSEMPLSVQDGITGDKASNSGVARREKYKQPSRKYDQSSRRRAK